jgi:hypothetical protein
MLDDIRAHLRAHFAAKGFDIEPDSASVTFLGVERIDVLRFGPLAEPGGRAVVHYVSVGCARHPMGDPAALAADPVRGPRAEIVMSLHDGVPTPGLARTIAVLAAAPAVDGVVLTGDGLIDFGSSLWQRPAGLPPFSAVVLSRSDIADLPLSAPCEPVAFLRALPITANEAAWVRLRGVDALREAWRQDRVDVTDPERVARQPT